MRDTATLLDLLETEQNHRLDRMDAIRSDVASREWKQCADVATWCAHLMAVLREEAQPVTVEG